MRPFYLFSNHIDLVRHMHGMTAKWAHSRSKNSYHQHQTKKIKTKINPNQNS